MELVLDSAYVANESGSYVEGYTEAGETRSVSRVFRNLFVNVTRDVTTPGDVARTLS